MKFLRTLPYLFISTILFCSSLYSASTDSLHIFAHMRGDKKYDDFQYGKGIGDINKDGYDDIIVGAPGGTYAGPGGGYAKLYFGGAVFDTLADLIFRISDTTFKYCDFGRAIASGDFNGDGFKDIAIGAPLYGFFQPGVVYVYYGGPQMDTTTDKVLSNFGYYYWFGATLASGDINGDGIDDLIVGSPFDDLHGSGRIFIYLGGKAFGDTPPIRIEGPNLSRFSKSLCIAGDVNKDGCQDILVGAPSNLSPNYSLSKAYLIYGNKDNKFDTSAVFTSDSAHYETFGMFTSGLGDVNGDGYDDFGIMSDHYLKIYSGKTLEVLKRISVTPEGWNFQCLAGGVDINNDGYSDILVGIENRALNYAGTLAVFLGGKEIDTIPAFVNNGKQYLERFASSISVAGDVNKDGYKDLIIGSTLSVLYEGSASILSMNSLIDKVENNKEEIKGYKLNQNYPNPFNPTTTISYDLQEESSVEVNIYDIMGNEVRTFSFNSQISGFHNLTWDGRNSNNQTVSSGTYIYRIRAVSSEGRKLFERSSKMLLLK